MTDKAHSELSNDSDSNRAVDLNDIKQHKEEATIGRPAELTVDWPAVRKCFLVI